jgi:hypothetical protein
VPSLESLFEVGASKRRKPRPWRHSGKIVGVDAGAQGQQGLRGEHCFLLHMVLSILSGVISGYALPACICYGAEGLTLGVGGLTSIFALVGALTGIGDSTVKRIWSSTTEVYSGIQIEMPDEGVRGRGSINFDSESRSVTPPWSSSRRSSPRRWRPRSRPCSWP